MGIFDFIFGKKDNRPSTPSRPSARNVFGRSSYDRNWKRIIEVRIASLKAEGVDLGFNLSNEYYVNLTIQGMLKGYLVGTNPNAINPNEFKYRNDYSKEAFDGLTTLFSRSTEHEEYVKKCKKGLIYIMVQVNLLQSAKFGSRLPSYLISLSGEDDGYYTSLMLDLMDEHEVRKQLHVLMLTYIQLPETNFENLKEELLDRIYKYTAPRELGVNVFDDPSVVQSYVDIRRKQYEHGGGAQKMNDAYKDTTGAWLKSISQPEAYLKLLAYELFNNSRKTDGDKLMLKELTQKSSVDYDTLQALLKLFNSEKKSSNLISGTWIHKIVKGYFVNEPIDPQSYTQIKKSITVCDTVSRAKKMNDFLYSKSGALYNLHSADVHELLHSGELHDVAISRYYGGNKDATTYVNNVLALVNQIMPAVMLQEGKNAYTVRIGSHEISMGTKELSKINNALAGQGVPYQLVDVPFTYAQDKKQTNLVSTLILNNDQFEIVQGYINTRSHSSDDQINCSGLRFVETVGEADPLINVVSKLKKAQSSSVASNRFIHDVKWKDVKLDVVDQLANPRLWYGAMHHIVSAPNTVRPSDTWKKKMQAIKEEMTEEDYAMGIVRLVQHMEDNDIWFTKDNLKALRGVIWASSLMEEDLALAQMESICERCFERVTGVGPRSISGGNCSIAALVDMQTPKAYSSLVRLQREAKYDRLKNQIAEELWAFEKKYKSTVALLKEAAQEDFGFEHCMARMVVEDYEVRWEIKNYKTKSRWYDNQGNKLSKSPKVKNNTITQEISAMTRDINQAVGVFYKRMEEYRFADLRWSSEEWQRNYVNHGFVSLIMDRLLWIVDRAEGKSESFIVREGKVIDVFGNSINLEEHDVIRVYHKTLVLDEVNEAWKSFFVKHNIEPSHDYFYDQSSLDYTQDELLDALNEFTVTYELRNWSPVRAPHALSLQLLYIDKIAVLKNIDKAAKANGDKAELVYYRFPDQLPKYNYTWELLTDQSPLEEISKTVHYEVMNDVISGLVMSIVKGGGFKDRSASELLKYSFFREMDIFFTKLTDQRLIPGLKYDDLALTFKGAKDQFKVDLRTLILEKTNKLDADRYYSGHMHVAPNINYAMKVGMSIKLDPAIQAYLWTIPQIIKGEPTRSAYRLDEWINKK